MHLAASFALKEEPGRHPTRIAGALSQDPLATFDSPPAEADSVFLEITKLHPPGARFSIARRYLQGDGFATITRARKPRAPDLTREGVVIYERLCKPTAAWPTGSSSPVVAVAFPVPLADRCRLDQHQ